MKESTNNFLENTTERKVGNQFRDQIFQIFLPSFSATVKLMLLSSEDITSITAMTIMDADFARRFCMPSEMSNESRAD